MCNHEFILIKEEETPTGLIAQWFKCKKCPYGYRKQLLDPKMLWEFTKQSELLKIVTTNKAGENNMENGKTPPSFTGVVQEKEGDKYTNVAQIATWVNTPTGNQPVQKSVITFGEMKNGVFVPSGKKLYVSQWKPRF